MTAWGLQTTYSQTAPRSQRHLSRRSRERAFGRHCERRDARRNLLPLPIERGLVDLQNPRGFFERRRVRHDHLNVGTLERREADGSTNLIPHRRSLREQRRKILRLQERSAGKNGGALHHVS